ncbi:MAG: hypothetical protein P8J45_03555 [Phycisphaerales bacterium]|jgi:hypothetical protein|nr:hypothetical protein [Phycisphaerales bacterium]
MLANVTLNAFGETISETLKRMDLMARPELLLDSLESMSVVLASILLFVGAICLVRGWRWHRLIVLVLALLGGVGIGHMLSLSMGRSMVVAIAIGLLCAALAAPMLKWTIAILAGGVGAFVGANAWGLLAPDDAAQAWAGASMGFIGLALASFILSRVVITFFMSVSGGVLFVTGSIALLLHVESVRTPILTHLEEAPMVVPLLVVVASVLGFIIQRPAGGHAAGDEDHEAASA